MSRGKMVKCFDHSGRAHWVAKDKLIFRPSVYGILIERGRILLSPQYDGYDFPGGGQNVGENINETLEREFFEETGFKVKRLMPVACETSFYRPRREDQYWNCLLIYFLCQRIGGKLSNKYFDDEEKKYARLAEWIPLEKIVGLNYANSVDSVAIIKEAQRILKK